MYKKKLTEIDNLYVHILALFMLKVFSGAYILMDMSLVS